MGSYLGGAILAGIGAGGNVLSQQMMQEISRKERFDETLRNQQIMERERQRDRIELLGLRQAGAGGTGAGGGKKGGVLDLASGAGEEQMARAAGMSLPEYRQFIEAERTGNYDKYKQTQVTDDESGGSVQTALPPEFDNFVKQKRATISKNFETYTFSDDINKIADSRQTDTMTGLVEKAATGDRKAGEGVLYMKGKDPRESDAKATQAIAKSTEADAKADLASRTNPNIRGGGGGGGGGRAPDPTKAVESERKALGTALVEARKAMEAAPSRAAREQRQAEYDAARTAYQTFVSKYGDGKSAPPAAPAAAPAAAAKPKYPDGTRLKGPDGKVYVVRGGRPVLE